MSKNFMDLKEALGSIFDLYVYVNGKFERCYDAKISAWDHGFMYGDAVFDTARFYNGRVFRLDEHIDRLYDSLKGIWLEIPLTRDELKNVVLETIRKNNLRDGQIRVIVSRGVGLPGLDPRRVKMTSIVVYATPLPPLLGTKPVRLLVSSVRKKSPVSMDSKIKCTNYLDSILAKIQSVVAGFDDAIMLDPTGLVAECSGENIFIVRKHKLYTPSSTACLEGITRETVIMLAKILGYEVQEKDITVQELYRADEIFLTGTAAEIVPVSEIDGRKIGVGAPGPITKKIVDAFRKCVKEEYLTPVYE